MAMLLWAGILHGVLPAPLGRIPAPYWHAHEMVYGYALAVVAGFLLTAVRNWTGLMTVHGTPLAALFLCWLFARIAVAIGTPALPYAALFDAVFWAALVLAVAIPVLRVRHRLLAAGVDRGVRATHERLLADPEPAAQRRDDRLSRVAARVHGCAANACMPKCCRTSGRTMSRLPVPSLI